MYPHQELARLAAHKASLRREIDLSRIQCAEAVSRVMRPLMWIERVVAFGRRAAPLALCVAVPVGLVVRRAAFSRMKVLGSLVRWGPLVFSAVRSLRTK